jgi:hypothetical protein
MSPPHLLLDVLQGDIDAAVVVSNDSDLRLPLVEVRKRVSVGTVNPSSSLHSARKLDFPPPTTDIVSIYTTRPLVGRVFFLRYCTIRSGVRAGSPARASGPAAWCTDPLGRLRSSRTMYSGRCLTSS